MLKAFRASLRTNILLHHIKKRYQSSSINQNNTSPAILWYKDILYHKMEVTWTYFWYVLWSPTSLQPLNHLTLTIYDICVLTLLIRKILDFWSIVFLVFLACKRDKFLLLFKQHRGKIYTLSSCKDPAFMTKQSNLNPPEKSKIPIKYNHFF